MRMFATTSPYRSLSTSNSTANPRPEVYDVVCVGGGPAGLTLVAALRMYWPLSCYLMDIYHIYLHTMNRN